VISSVGLLSSTDAGRETKALGTRPKERGRDTGSSVNFKDRDVYSSNVYLRNDGQKTSTFALKGYGGQASGLPAVALREGWNAANSSVRAGEDKPHTKVISRQVCRSSIRPRIRVMIYLQVNLHCSKVPATVNRIPLIAFIAKPNFILREITT
jgi:hypothetical protein